MKNKKVKIKKVTNLSDHYYQLDRVDFAYKMKDGTWQDMFRECYDRGDGACILLYNTERKTVILTEQFRMPSYLNGNDTGMMIEVCAGLLDDNDPVTCIKKEAEEETGYQIEDVKEVMVLYSTPGAVTEKIHYFIGKYNNDMKVGDGGGLDSENEEITVMEIPFSKAMEMIKTGKIKDAKTVVLLQYAQINGLV